MLDTAIEANRQECRREFQIYVLWDRMLQEPSSSEQALHGEDIYTPIRTMKCRIQNDYNIYLAHAHYVYCHVRH